jgi:protein involved in polysaccharide export with SLBB domain
MKVLIKIFLVIVYLTFNTAYAQKTEQLLQKGSDSRLLQPITVTIGGNFIVNGSFTALATQRVDHLITQVFTEAQEKSIGNINQLEILKKINEQFAKYPLRDILLKRMNGDQIKLDLLKYRLTGDFSFNPYLLNDDVIIFPGYDEKTNFVEISGAVNNPLKFQFVEGDKLSDAILFARGINNAYENVTIAEISRLYDKGTREEIIKVNLSDNINLERGDRIRIPYEQNNKREFKVLVLGEVNTPGYVYITKNNTTIREVINKVNGFTQNAWLERSELLKGTSESQVLKMESLRKSFEKDRNYNFLLSEKLLNELNVEQLKLFRMADTFPQDSMVVIIDNALRLIDNKSIIDFTEINSDSVSDGNYVVNDGDIIVVPKKEDLVYVFGQVKNPGYVKYENGKNYNYYVNKAGGLGERAEDEVKIIKGSSYSWITAELKSAIDPGDFIYVPKNVPKSLEYYLRAIGSISSVVTAIATIILIVMQSGK